MDLLARGSNFEITAEGRLVRCRVINAPQVDREQGARCAQEMHDVLTSRVLTKHSGYAGLVFDVRQGPEVFGPITRSALELLFRAAATATKRLAVRVGAAAIQRLQFTSLCRECAPAYAKVVDSDRDEDHWVNSRRQPKSET